jgi:hypothetical protein
MPYFAGLDAGLHKTALCIVDGEGSVCLGRSVPSEIDDVVAALRAFGKEVGSVGLGAGTLTQAGLRAALGRVQVPAYSTTSHAACGPAPKPASSTESSCETAYKETMGSIIYLSAREALCVSSAAA